VRAEASCAIDSHAHGPLEFTLPFPGLKCLSDLPAGPLTIRIAPVSVDISTPDAAPLTFASLDPAEFPLFPAAPAEVTRYTVRSDDLRRVIGAVRHAVSRESTRYYLNGALFHCHDSNTLRVVATDGHRLALAQVPAAGLLPGAPAVIVPGRSLAVLWHHCKAMPGGSVQVASHSAGIAFDFGHTVQSKVIDGTFPDYARIMPKDPSAIAVFDRKTLRDALAGLKGPRGRDRDVSLVKLTLEGAEATLSRSLPGQGPVAACTLPCHHDGDRVKIGFELRFLTDALGVLGSTVRFALSGPREPALITSDETPGVQLVIMPRVVPDAPMCAASLREEA
jgi:DNA polymerase-3 subunit beta